MGVEGDQLRAGHRITYTQTDRHQLSEAAGFEITFVEFEHDAPEKLQDAWYENGEANCSAWHPSKPDGDGWTLVGIWYAEDGPLAFYVREAAAA